jgi:hypothetical protein
MKIKYQDHRFSATSLMLIGKANEIITDYTADGYDLTLRQLYYQFVSRDIIANNQKEYKRLGSVINDARLAGLVSWTAIEDRTRNLQGNTHWDSPAQILRGAQSSFRIEKWANQPYRVEVWVEKDALIGVVERACTGLDIDYFSCRGYVSQSEMWGAARRLKRYEKDGQETVILHLGDHDPSGIDMTRDMGERLRMFGSTCDIRRIALNMEQVDKYSPPPNPAKTSDSRFESYIKLYGEESWELDALEPKILNKLIEKHVKSLRDDKLWAQMVEKEDEGKQALQDAIDAMENVGDE